MSTVLRPLTINIIEKTNLMLLQDGLTEKQYRFLENILANAEDFYGKLEVFQSASLEEITSSMRHDLANPLTPIFGYTQLLLSHKAGGLTYEQHDCVQHILDDARMLFDEVERYVAAVKATRSS